MNVRARFRVYSVQQFNNGPEPGVVTAEQVELHAVNTSDGKGCESWAKYTPNGKVTMTIDASGAVGVFKPGQQYYLDFSPVE